MGLYERSYMRSGGDAGADSKAMIKKLIIANVIVFFAAKFAPQLEASLILTGASMHRFEFFRIVTAAFLHFDFWHILLNMWGLYLFGTVVAPYLRSRQILWLYLIGGIMLDDGKIEALVKENVAKLSIKTPSSKTQIQSLSGGNQQKVLIGRWLANNPDVLILDEPTRGIDVGAKYEIYCIIEELARMGKSIIMISSEMAELIGMSDRVMVMCDGRVTGFIDGAEATQENIMELATQFESAAV